MNQNFFSHSVTIFLFLLAVSCTQQEGIVEDYKVLTEVQLTRLADAEQAGSNHNLALDYLATNSNLETVTKEQKFSIISDFFISISTSEADKAALLAAKKSGCSSCSFNYSSISEWVNAKRNILTEKEAFYMLELEGALSAYHKGGVEKVVNELKKIEREMVRDENLTSHSILVTSAILRHSLQYWDGAYSDPEHPYYSVVNRDISFRTCTWCIYVALVDAVSYSDCLSNGGFGTYETARTVCMNQAAYTSALYY